jgi:hypothetical protein
MPNKRAKSNPRASKIPKPPKRFKIPRNWQKPIPGCAYGVSKAELATFMKVFMYIAFAHQRAERILSFRPNGGMIAGIFRLDLDEAREVFFAGVDSCVWMGRRVSTNYRAPEADTNSKP